MESTMESKMERTIASLRLYQISNFFLANSPTTQQECNERAETIMGIPPEPALVQGGSSYTVIAGDQVIPFQAPQAALDLE